MRIAYVIQAFPRPSETFVAREVIGLRRMGVEIDVFVAGRSRPQEMAKLSAPMRAEADVAHLIRLRDVLPGSIGTLTRSGSMVRLNRYFTSQAKGKPNSVLRLLRGAALGELVRRGRYDRLHAHWPYGTHMAALAHVATGIPFSISVHAHEVGHDFGHFPEVFKLIDLATFCNAAAMHRLLERLPPGSERLCHLVYHGVNLEQFELTPPPPPPPPLRLVSAGRLTATKGHDRLVRAMARLIEAGVETELTLVGDGPERSAIEQLAASLGIGSQLTITGWLPHEQVAQYLKRAHVFALLADTGFHDGLPNVVLEAQGIGRPAVLSPLPAAAEAVCHGDNGFVLSAPDAYDEFVSVLAPLAGNPKELARLGERARAHVLEHFEESIHHRHLLDLLSERSPVTPGSSFSVVESRATCVPSSSIRADRGALQNREP